MKYFLQTSFLGCANARWSIGAERTWSVVLKTCCGDSPKRESCAKTRPRRLTLQRNSPWRQLQRAASAAIPQMGIASRNL